MHLERFYPSAGKVTVDEMLASLDPVSQAHADRPYVTGTFITSVDGRATLGGKSGGLGDDADRAIFRGLRGTADAILVGTGTLRAEKYGRAGRSEALRQARAERGLPEEPTIMIVSRSMNLPTDIPLMEDKESRVRLYTPSDAPAPRIGAQLEVTRLGADGGLDAVLRTARREHGIRAIDCEGGPTLFGALVAIDAVDELFLTVAPIWTGSGEVQLSTDGPVVPSRGLELVAGYRHGSRLYLRYARNRA
jgi:riboflavin biosynthesis pyrimidine reductase